MLGICGPWFEKGQGPQYENFGLQLTIKGTGAGTSTVQVFGSADSTSYQTTPSFAQVVALSGTAPVTYFFNANVVTVL